MLEYWFKEQLPATIIVIIAILTWFVTIIYHGDLAWRHPSKLKDKYVAQTQRWPKWIPFRNYFISHYGSNEFVWSVRIFTIISLLIPLTLLVITVLGLLGLVK
jgi:hypothetical protein